MGYRERLVKEIGRSFKLTKRASAFPRRFLPYPEEEIWGGLKSDCPADWREPLSPRPDIVHELALSMLEWE